METVKENPLGFEKIGKLLLSFSVPAIMSNLLNALYNIFDQIFIGRGIGYGGNAATAIAFPLVTITAAIAIMLGTGSAANFNLTLGAGKREEAERTAGNGLSLMVICGVGITVISLIFLTPLLYLFGATDEILGLAKAYTSIVVLGTPFQILVVSGSFIIRADGSPKWAMFSMMCGAVLKLIISPIFMFVLDLGIRGIAWATVICQFLSACVVLTYLIRGLKSVRLTKESFRLRFSCIKTICALGLAGFVNQIAVTLMNITLNNTLRYYGDLSHYGSTVALGAAGVISRINSVFSAFVVGVGQGAQPISGFNFGAKNYERVRETLRFAVTCNTAVAVVFFAIFQIFPRAIISIFGAGTPDYLEFATRYLRIFMLLTFVNGHQSLASNYFASTGRAYMGVFISLTRQIIFLIPLLLILPRFFGIDGAMFAGPISDCAAAVLCLTFYAREFKKLNRLTVRLD